MHLIKNALLRALIPPPRAYLPLFVSLCKKGSIIPLLLHVRNTDHALKTPFYDLDPFVLTIRPKGFGVHQRESERHNETIPETEES
jgi:hypothetical protein